MTERFVVIGAGLTGGTAAATLREYGFDGEVTLIGTEAHPPYERPPLSKAYLRGEVAFEDSLVRPEAFWPAHGVQAHLGVTATALDLERRVVALSDGEEVPFDRLLLATGARNRRPSIPGFNLDGVFGLRTLEECDRIRAAAVPGARAVLAGMGFIGCEVAASLRSLGVEVMAIDAGSVPLERVVGPEVGSVLGAVHREHGVVMVSGDRVAAFEGHGRVERVVSGGGRTLECDLVVAGMGVEPVAELALAAGIDVENGVLVDDRCRTSADGVFAAGDVANHDHPVFGRHMRVEHWDNAIRHGRAAALSMLGRDTPYQDIPWFWSDQYDQNLQYAGYCTGWDRLVVRGSLPERAFTAFYLQDGVVQAVVALNRGREARQAMPLIRARAAVDPERLADQGVNLLDLVPRGVALAEADRSSTGGGST